MLRDRAYILSGGLELVLDGAAKDPLCCCLRRLCCKYPAARSLLAREGLGEVEGFEQDVAVN